MKSAISILLACLLLCACSHKHNAVDRIQPGHDITCAGGYVVHVAKRQGSSIHGVRIERKSPDGSGSIVTADNGILVPGPSAGTVSIVLKNVRGQAHGRTGPMKFAGGELTFVLKP